MRHAYRSFHHSRGEFGREERRGIGAAAAVAATVATVAAVGVSVASKAGAFGGGAGGGGAAGGGYVPPGLRERMFNRGTQTILDTERQVLDDSIAQGKYIEPEMYRALGLEPIYDREEDPGVAERSSALAGKQARLQQLRLERSALKAQKKVKGKQKQMKALNREANQLNRDISSLTEAVEQDTAVGRRIVGFRNLPGAADPTGSTGNRFGGVLDDFNAHLDAALAGREPLDPTLQNEFQERERTLRENLRRHLGPDYESSSAGIEALADFGREKAEAFAQYNRQSIEGFAGLAERRASAVSDLTSERLRALAFAPTFRGALGSQLNDLASARTTYTQGPAGEREAQGAAARRRQERRDAEAAARAQGLSDILAGVQSGGNTAAGYFNNQAATQQILSDASAVDAPVGVGGALLQ